MHPGCLWGFRHQIPWDELSPDVRTFLIAVHPRFHDRFAAYLESIEGLPLDNPLNLGTVITLVDIDLAADGSLHDVRVARTSGVVGFDSAVVDVVRHGAPYPEPPARIVRENHVVLR